MFNGLKLTDKGLEMLTKLLNGHNIEFTHIKMGDGDAPSSIKTLDDLVNTKQILGISRNSIVNKETMLIGANLFGVDVKEGFYWKEVGLFAKDNDEDGVEHLFSYDNAGDEPSFIPAGGAVAEQLIDLNVVVGNVDNVTITIDKSLVYATADELEKQTKAVEDTLTEKINTDVKAVNDALDNHMKDKENPHEVTAEQVGLGNVNNYGTATKAQATAGTASDKFMTPQRTKEAVEAYSAITDGNVIIKISNTKPAVQSGKTIIWIDTSS